MRKNQDGGYAHDELIEALERSVKLQSHYAWLLNQYDAALIALHIVRKVILTSRPIFTLIPIVQMLVSVELVSEFAP
jgi:hypothetical protein